MKKVELLRINEEYRNLFPDLAESLEKIGLKAPILKDTNGYIIDGEKRKLLLGEEQIKQNTLEVPVGSECSNLSGLTNEQKKPLVLDLYTQLVSNETVETSVKILMKRYGLSRATVYRWLNPEAYEYNDERAKEKKVAKLKSSTLHIMSVKSDISYLESAAKMVQYHPTSENIQNLLMYVETAIGHMRLL
jgi:hypothetical protein